MRVRLSLRCFHFHVKNDFEKNSLDSKTLRFQLDDNLTFKNRQLLRETLMRCDNSLFSLLSFF